MSDDNLLEFVKNVDWAQWIEDEDIRGHVQAIKEKVEGGEGDGEGGDVDIANATRIKLVVVGDGAVGKTSLLISYATDKFPTEYVPTVFENFTAQMDYNNETILLHLWDTAGQEDYDRLRPLSYPGSDVVLLCFSTVSPTSYESIKVKWYPEVNHYVPSVPHFLIGTKLDLREEKWVDPDVGKFEEVTTQQGEEMAKDIKAIKYMEISSKTRQGLEALFQEAVKTVLGMMGAASGEPGGEEADEAVKNLVKTKKKGGCVLL